MVFALQWFIGRVSATELLSFLSDYISFLLKWLLIAFRWKTKIFSITLDVLFKMASSFLSNLPSQVPSSPLPDLAFSAIPDVSLFLQSHWFWARVPTCSLLWMPFLPIFSSYPSTIRLWVTFSETSSLSLLCLLWKFPVTALITLNDSHLHAQDPECIQLAFAE